MFAVIQTGGKQYTVAPGAVVNVEKLAGDVGDKIELKEVLLVSNGEADVRVGRPFVSGASVKLEIVGQTKGEKLMIFKKLRRHGHQLKKGHRQQLTRVRVTDISI